MEAPCSSEILVSIYKTTRCHNPKDHNLNEIIVIEQVCVAVGLWLRFLRKWQFKLEWSVSARLGLALL
jgi:hypothetical protein